MKKRLLFIPAIGLPLLTIIPAICNSYSSIKPRNIDNKTDVIAQTDINNYTIVTPELTHYKIGEKLDLRDLKVTYNDPEKGAINVTNECKLSMQNDQELTQEGELDVTIQHNEFNGSFKIYVEKEPTEVQCDENIQKMGEINVKFRLMLNQECIFTCFEGGKGTLEIPDFVLHNNVKYFIKQIPSDWSNDENSITGLVFKDCKHLKKICDNAFAGTNCLDYYIDHKDQLLEFPEGLEEIGPRAFSGTAYGISSIKGYSFPSTLKKINDSAFEKSPHINGDNDNGVLEFKSVPEIANNAFEACWSQHNCQYIYAPTLEIGHQIAKILSRSLSSDDTFNFKHGSKYLIPRVNNANYEIIEWTFGDIVAKCAIQLDEAMIIQYVSGTGTLTIPDSIIYNGNTFYIKVIPSYWSDGENNITGLKFADDCRHLKTICGGAFAGTNCLDYYINHKDELLIFPEGLEEIEYEAFYNTDCGQNKIKGYSFPSTLKEIGSKAFFHAPYIDGDDDNGELHFKSIPEIVNDAFYIPGALSHDCKFIYGKTQEMAEQMVKLIKDNLSDDFSTGSDYLIPKAIEQTA